MLTAEYMNPRINGFHCDIVVKEGAEAESSGESAEREKLMLTLPSRAVVEGSDHEIARIMTGKAEGLPSQSPDVVALFGRQAEWSWKPQKSLEEMEVEVENWLKWAEQLGHPPSPSDLVYLDNYIRKRRAESESQYLVGCDITLADMAIFSRLVRSLGCIDSVPRFPFK